MQKAEIVKKKNGKVIGKAKFDSVRNGYIVTLTDGNDKDILVFEESNVNDYNKNHVLEMLCTVFMDFFCEDAGKRAKVRLKFGYRTGDIDIDKKEKETLEKELGYDLED